MDNEALAEQAQRIVPLLPTSDMQETLAFYEQLGFSIHGVHPDRDNATWARVTFGAIAIMFFAEQLNETSPPPVSSGTFYVDCANIDALVERWQPLTDLAWGPEKMWYGTYEFAIKDPNGTT